MHRFAKLTVVVTMLVVFQSVAQAQQPAQSNTPVVQQPKVDDLLSRPFITILTLTFDPMTGEMNGMADVRGRYIGKDDSLDEEPPVSGLVPVMVYVKRGKTKTFARGWAWPHVVKACEARCAPLPCPAPCPAPCPPAPQACCQQQPVSQVVYVGDGRRTPDYTNVNQINVINNIDVNVLIQQSTQVTQQAWMPDNCSCGRRYRGYYHHPVYGYWGYSHCRRPIRLG